MSDMTFADVLEEFRQRRIDASKSGSTTTADRYCYEVVKWAAWLNREHDKWVWETDRKDAPTFYDLQDRLRQMKREDLSVSMRNVHTSAVSKFYQELRKLGKHPNYSLPADPPDNPYDHEEFDKEERRKWLKGQTKKSQGINSEDEIYYLDPDEIRQLVENVPSPTLRNELIVRLAFDTGLRRGELASIKWNPTDGGHIDREEHTIYVPAFKSSQDRTVTYTDDYVDYRLDQWLDGTRGRKDRRSVYNADKSDYLFPTHESEHISGYTINEIVKEAAERAGLQKTVAEYSDGREIRLVNAHTIRHSHAVQAVKSDIDVRRLAESMGHIAEDGTVNIETTMQYLRMAEKDYVEESRKFAPHSGD